MAANWPINGHAAADRRHHLGAAPERLGDAAPPRRAARTPRWRSGMTYLRAIERGRRRCRSCCRRSAPTRRRRCSSGSTASASPAARTSTPRPTARRAATPSSARPSRPRRVRARARARGRRARDAAARRSAAARRRSTSPAAARCTSTSPGHRQTEPGDASPTHEVEIAPGSRLAALLGATRARASTPSTTRPSTGSATACASSRGRRRRHGRGDRGAGRVRWSACSGTPRRCAARAAVRGAGERRRACAAHRRVPTGASRTGSNPGVRHPGVVAVPALRLRGVVKRFGAITAVDGLDLDVPEGTCVGLLGPERRRQVDDDAAAHRRRRSPTRARSRCSATRCPRESKAARAEMGVVPQLDNLDIDADGRAEPARLRPPLPGPARDRAGRGRARARDRQPHRPPRHDASTSSPAACAGGC